MPGNKGEEAIQNSANFKTKVLLALSIVGHKDV